MNYLAAVLLLILSGFAFSADPLTELGKVVKNPGHTVEDINHGLGIAIQSPIQDPIGTLINPGKYINTLGVPTQGDFMEFVFKNPELVIKLSQNPNQIPYLPVANLIMSNRNAALQSGTSVVPDMVKQKLRQWYSDDLINSVRWNASNNLLNGIQQSFSIHQLGAKAITLINVVVFRSNSDAQDIAIWGHELFHVQQYRDLGVFEFSRKYVINRSDLESPAYQRQNEISNSLSLDNTVSELQTDSIVLSANGAAAGNQNDYNANQSLVKYTIRWNPGNISEVTYVCIDNCVDLNKFDYRINIENGRMVLTMKATTGLQGLVRIKLSALVN
jgi:hypothetical protein